MDRQATVEPVPSAPTAKAGELMSHLVERYLDDTSREREWPSKTVLRKRGELREFLEVAGDKPVNAYRQADGVNFKDVEMALPIYRHKAPFKGLTLVDAAKKASELRAGGENVDLLNPITINDKIGTVSLFFEWAIRAEVERLDLFGLAVACREDDDGNIRPIPHLPDRVFAVAVR